jgi:hypothetical protein
VKRDLPQPQPFKRVYTIWPSTREGVIATSSSAWRQDRYWLVLDVSDGISVARIVEGPVDRATALRRELELRAIAKAEKGAA